VNSGAGEAKQIPAPAFAVTRPETTASKLIPRRARQGSWHWEPADLFFADASSRDAAVRAAALSDHPADDATRACDQDPAGCLSLGGLFKANSVCASIEAIPLDSRNESLTEFAQESRSHGPNE